MPVSANSPNNSESADEPETITDLSELSFDFEEATPSNRRPVYGSATEDLSPGELTEELELLDSLAGQITGDGPPEFYCKPLGQLLGPMSLAELRIMAESGSLAEDDLVRYGENGEWKPASSLPRLAESLHRGSSITAAPVASAPPSTRRLFQTGFRPTGDSFGEDTSNTPPKTALDPAAAAPEKEVAPAPAAVESKVVTSDKTPVDNTSATVNTPAEASESNDKSHPEAETQTQAIADPRRKKSAKKSPGAKKAGKKSSAKKKPAKKRNDEDDAILNDIFSEVFADDQKTQRSSMPPAASSATEAPATASESVPNQNNDPASKTAETPASK